MQVNVKNLVSITEANQNFSKVARMVDQDGAAVVLKNNKPRYIILDYYSVVEKSNEIADDQTVEEISERLLKKHIQAFKELAK